MRRFASIISVLIGIAFILSGAVAWGLVSSQLSEENITVPDDAPWSRGDRVDGPISAFAQAEIIKEHALAGAEGHTYAELGGLAGEAQAAGDTELAEQYTEQRATVMNGSFLRASLFTSVLAFGVSAMAMATGLALTLLGLAAGRRGRDGDRTATTGAATREVPATEREGYDREVPDTTGGSFRA